MSASKLPATRKEEPTIKLRYRLVTVTARRDEPAETHTSSVILTDSEARDSLQVEATLARQTGWRIMLADDDMIIVERPGVSRTIIAVPSTPFDDTIT